MDIESLVFGQDNQTSDVKDELGELAKTHFQKFLEEYRSILKDQFLLNADFHRFSTSSNDEDADENDNAPLPDYLQKIEEMMANDTTTLYVDFSHLLVHDQVLAEALELHYYRF